MKVYTIMCGYCQEGTAIELARLITSGATSIEDSEEFVAFKIYYIQEGLDVSEILSRFEVELTEIVSNFRYDAENKPSKDYISRRYFQVVWCRIADTLVKSGFDSSEYQRILAHPLTEKFILLQREQPAISDERFGVYIRPIETLFQTDLFFNNTHSQGVQYNHEIVTDCLALLRAYVDWWHFGKQAKEDDLLDEIELYVSLYPYVYFSYLIVEKMYPRHELITQIVRHLTRRAGIPDDTLDFWLQRKAALTLYATKGLDAFLPFGEQGRSALLYYVLVKNTLSQIDKDRLRVAIFDPREYEEDIKFIATINKPRHINMNAKFFIMHYLS